MKNLLIIVSAWWVISILSEGNNADGEFSFDMSWKSDDIKSAKLGKVCPNNRTKCKDTQTCCVTKHGSYHCCRYKNAVCCPDKYHCCPHGNTCDAEKKRCVRRVDSSHVDFEVIEKPMEWPIVDKTMVESENQICPNNRTRCKESQTCCLTKHGSYHCCKFQNAICCADKYHCCPEGATCDMKKHRCVKSNVQMLKLVHSDTLFSPEQKEMNLRNVEEKIDPLGNVGQPNLDVEAMCPNNKTKCKDTKTCCITLHGNYYCCPHKNAVCCSDKWQCCPEGTTCDIKNKKCLSSSFSRDSFMVDSDVIKPYQLKPAEEIQFMGLLTQLLMKLEKKCQNSKLTCPGKRNCCVMEGGKFGCCNFNKGVCCPDMKTCCPHGTTCDVKNNKCVSNSVALVPIN